MTVRRWMEGPTPESRSVYVGQMRAEVCLEPKPTETDPDAICGHVFHTMCRDKHRCDACQIKRTARLIRENHQKANAKRRKREGRL